ncbi:MAG: hypothetical protein LC677_03425, partial [Halomonas sp.]|nr:hypothetical protein [Halomonas sp.]
TRSRKLKRTSFESSLAGACLILRLVKFKALRRKSEKNSISGYFWVALKTYQSQEDFLPASRFFN